MKALALLVRMGGGLRPSDRIMELGYRGGTFYVVVYEAKCDRYRLICEEFDELWRELLREEELRRWLLELVEKHGERLLQQPFEGCVWRLTDEDWMKISSSLSKSEKRIAKRVYLCYQMPDGQALVLTMKNGHPLIVGVHIDPLNDGYYIAR